MTNRIPTAKAESSQAIKTEKPGKNQVIDSMVENTRRMLAPLLVIGSLTSPSNAQTPTQNSAATNHKASESAKLSGVASVGIQYFSTGYRKGSNFRLQLNGSRLGPITTSVAGQLNSASTTGLSPAVSVNAATSIPIAPRAEKQPSYIAVNPVISAGTQFVMAGLDSEKTTDYLVLPYAAATLNIPIYAALDSSAGNYFTFTPSVNYLRYLRNSDYGLKVDDKNADGTPDFMRPKQQLYFGVNTGITYDNNKSFINTGLFYDPFDPSLKKNEGKSIFGYLNIGRSF